MSVLSFRSFFDSPKQDVWNEMQDLTAFLVKQELFATKNDSSVR